MNVNGKHYRTIWVHPGDKKVIQIIDQRYLPHEFIIVDLKTSEDVAVAIKSMQVRGAGLIGAAAGYGMYLAALEAPKDSSKFDSYVQFCGQKLKETRPTAMNLAWAVDRIIRTMGKKEATDDKVQTAFEIAETIANEDAEFCRMIGEYGLSIIREIYEKKKDTVNILTHCNAGWLAFVDYGSALSPVYAAHDAGIPVHVYTDITGPWNQGAKLTAWELGKHGVPYTSIADNTGGHMMQHGMIDMCIVGADRVTRCGDAANKIGTYLKALAAKDNDVPFYVALPSSTFDWTMRDGVREIPIEERGSEEVKYTSGLCDDGKVRRVLITPPDANAVNYGFDVTPRDFITGLITERGICRAEEKDILRLFPEHKE